ncbi:MAG TPA: hypothetical protein VEV62_10880 [Parafilimonas sp.]|nr:hypothetical protein [Parafilimonas sp.]
MTKAAVAPWSFTQKFVFRFFLVLFLLYIFFNPNGVLPYSDYAYEFYIQPFHTLMVWIGKDILHLSYPITVFTNGSGDTTYDYIVIFFIAVVSLIAAITWSLIDKKTKTYNKLFYWLCVIVRYYVAITMFSYGFVKVFKLQFPFFSPDRLLEPYGNSSPMGLAWNFLGFSKGYNYVMGFAELSSGILLLFRRTTTLGAIVTLVVAGNIMAINYCFDVPVKLLSTALVVMALFLLAKDIHRVVNFFFLNKPTNAANIAAPVFRKKWQNIATVILKYGLILYVAITNVLQATEAMKEYGDVAPKPPLYGIYNVEYFIRNNDTIAPLATDTTRWKKLIVSYPEYSFVQFMNDSTKGFAFKPDTIKKRIEIFSYNDTTKKSNLVYSFPQKDILLLTGKLDSNSVVIKMRKYDLKNFRLINRGFHWVNEYPYNR